METRSTHKQPIPTPATDMQAAGEGQLPEKTDTLGHGGPRSSSEPSNAQIEGDNGDVSSNQNDPETQVIKIMTPIMHEAISEMNGQVRDTMFNIRDILEDARKRDSEELCRAIASSLPTISANMTPVLEQTMSQISESVKDAISEMAKVSQIMATRVQGEASVASVNKYVTPEPAPVVMDPPITNTLNSSNTSGTSENKRPPQMRQIRVGSNTPQGKKSFTPNHVDSSDSESERDILMIPSSTRGDSRSSGLRLPIFLGNDWKVWHNRFEDIARLHSWTSERKLIELLPKLQGVAGEFVYGQLSRVTRENYSTLVQELEYRFRKIETTRTFGSKFSNRGQRPGESVEDFAAELKSLYDKAYPNRDGVTRQEDLLRRFLDGLMDERTRVQVEFVKEPSNIDQAVYDVINFLETRRKSKPEVDKRGKTVARLVRPASDDSDDESDDEHEIGRAAKSRGKSAKPNLSINPVKIADGNNKNSATGTTIPVPASIDVPKESNDFKEVMSQISQALQQVNKSSVDIAKVMKNMDNRLDKLDRRPNRSSQTPANNNRYPQSGPGSQNGQGGRNRSTPGNQNRTYTCYRCGQEGHFIRECPVSIVTGQLQVATQPMQSMTATTTTTNSTN